MEPILISVLSGLFMSVLVQLLKKHYESVDDLSTSTHTVSTILAVLVVWWLRTGGDTAVLIDWLGSAFAGAASVGSGYNIAKKVRKSVLGPLSRPLKRE